MLALYHGGLTTCSKQVRHCLREKGLAYESRYVNLMRFEHLSPAYMQVNPNGLVPTLVHDGHAIVNSACINEYIDEAFPEPRLSPTDLRERARMRLWTWTADDAHIHGARITHNNMLKAAVAAMPPDNLKLVLSRMTSPGFRERWQKMAEGGHSEKDIAVSIDHIRFVADRMEKELTERGPWLAGKTFSLADIAMAAIVHRVFEVYPDLLSRQTWPTVHDWYERLMARPAAKFVYTSGTEETPALPPDRSIAGIHDFRVAAGL